tara:strand:- start:1411 stop:1797 length:387 start_codon:yes stop_codon:yes gene_type:complete
MARKKSDTTVHMRMDMPISNRKDILATTIDVIALIQRYHKIQEIREQKEKELANFRTALRSLNRLSRLVRLKEMPLQMEEVKKVKSIKGKRVFAPVVRKPKKVVKKNLTEAEGLDEQLDLLRRKLESL